ncbi:MAG: hypothetical protein AAF191_13815 [Verrucomicrobiota bacterium]
MREACLAELEKAPGEEMENCVKAIYEPFGEEELSAQMAKEVTPVTPNWSGKVELVFQTIPNLHAAIPDHTGDWYFTGDYPTAGGVAAVNRAFVYHCDKTSGRPCDEWI